MAHLKFIIKDLFESTLGFFGWIIYEIACLREYFRYAAAIIIGLIIAIATALPFTQYCLGPWIVTELEKNIWEEKIDKFAEQYSKYSIYYNDLHHTKPKLKLKNDLEKSEKLIEKAKMELDLIEKHSFLDRDKIVLNYFPKLEKILDLDIPRINRKIDEEIETLYHGHVPEIMNGKIVREPKAKN